MLAFERLDISDPKTGDIGATFLHCHHLSPPALKLMTAILFDNLLPSFGSRGQILVIPFDIFKDAHRGDPTR